MYRALEEGLDLAVHNKEALALMHLPQQVGKRRSRQRRANVLSTEEKVCEEEQSRARWQGREGSELYFGYGAQGSLSDHGVFE